MNLTPIAIKGQRLDVRKSCAHFVVVVVALGQILDEFIFSLGCGSSDQSLVGFCRSIDRLTPSAGLWLTAAYLH